MSRRGLTLLGLGVAGGAGYYLYNAGGDPKVAQKQAEADAHKASAKIKSEIPGREKQAEKKGEELSARAGAAADKAEREAKSLYSDAKSGVKDAQARAQEYKDRTGKEINQAIDKFDAEVEKKASQAKGGISSWFGGK